MNPITTATAADLAQRGCKMENLIEQTEKSTRIDSSVLVEGHNAKNITEFASGAVRNKNHNKGRCDLLPMCSILRISHHMEDSLYRSNYPERNWEKGIPMSDMLDSAIRHLLKYMDGMVDEDHLAAAATNLLMAMWTEEKMPSMQNIPARIKAEMKLNE